jgi:hypothetical protein
VARPGATCSKLLTLIAFVFAIVAIQRTKRYYQQLAELDSQVRQLRALLDVALRRGRRERRRPRQRRPPPPSSPSA